MSACFYQDFSRMMGVDIHKGFPMLVFTDIFTFWPRTFWKETSTVLSDGFEMVQDGHDLKLVVHVPPPIPEAVPIAAEAIVTSSSKPFLCKLNVSGEGSALACCGDGFFGLNTNCWDVGLNAVPSGYVVSPNSVVTNPTIGDLVAAAVAVAVDNVLGAAGSGLTEGMDLLPKAILHHVVKPVISFVLKQVDQLAPEYTPIVAPLLGPLAPLTKGGDMVSDTKKGIQERVDRAVDEYFSDEE